MKKNNSTISIERGHKMPEKRFMEHGNQASLREAISKLKRNESFLWKDNKMPHKAAEDLGMKIKTRKINGEGFRVWKIPTTDAPE